MDNNYQNHASIQISSSMESVVDDPSKKTPSYAFSHGGSYATPQYWELRMNIYPISEDKLKNISSFSGASAVLFSFGSYFIQSALSSIDGIGLLTALRTDSSVQITLLCYFLGAISWYIRGDAIKQMKADCKPLNVSGTTNQNNRT